jgi:putative spermidine/putrescine transport system permease protein
VSAFLILPVALSVIGSFSEYWGLSMFQKGVTLKWYRYIWDNYAHTVKYSLIIAVCAVAADVILGVPAAYFLSRRGGRLLPVLEELFCLPTAIPGIAIALALIQTHNYLSGKWLFIVVAHVIFTLPLVIRPVVAALRTAELSLLEEAAASLGAKPFPRFWRVVVPNIRQAIIAGALMVFAVSLGEFNMTFFLYTPLTMTMPVGLYEAYASLRLEIGSAYTTIFLVLAIPLMALVQHFGGERVEGSGY